MKSYLNALRARNLFCQNLNQIDLCNFQLLHNGLLAWCTDKVHLLDAKSWEYQSSLSYKFKRYDKVSSNPHGQYSVIGTEGDVIIISHVTNQQWSLKNQLELTEA